MKNVFIVTCKSETRFGDHILHTPSEQNTKFLVQVSETLSNTMKEVK